jgi:anaphase-promoting complex subunit 1
MSGIPNAAFSGISGLTYGNHMAVSMSIGFLFLGGGAYTFATNNAAIAALLVSLFPRFPQTPTENRCHLQAFRHLYVIAAEVMPVPKFFWRSGSY